MVSHDYTKEVGLQSGQKKVSKPVAVILLAVLAAGVWYTIQTLAVPSAARSAMRGESAATR